MKRWSEEETEILKIKHKTMCIDDLALLLGRSEKSVEHKLLKLGLERNYRKVNKKAKNCTGCVYRENWSGLGSVCAYGLYNETSRPCLAENCTVKKLRSNKK